ncbi:hypothetical protein OG21DRAFT_1509925 [Imleria badia]|nr:hypothetical protein OG21DRAFT_1509925 [Imleria badia]
MGRRRRGDFGSYPLYTDPAVVEETSSGDQPWTQDLPMLRASSPWLRNELHGTRGKIRVALDVAFGEAATLTIMLFGLAGALSPD